MQTLIDFVDRLDVIGFLLAMVFLVTVVPYLIWRDLRGWVYRKRDTTNED